MLGRMWKRSRVLVTGGTGLVGSHCVEELLEKGAQVKIVVHNKKNLFGDSVEVINGDLTDVDTCMTAIRGADYIIHAAARSGGLGRNQNDPISTLIPNARMNLNILEAIEKYPPEVFHFNGNNSVYPDVPVPVKEEDAIVPLSGIAAHFSQIKILGETHCRYLYEKNKIKISITRGGNTYGENDNFDPMTSHTVPANIRKVVERANPLIIWSDGKGLRDYIHAKDLARGILLAMEKYAVADPVNIATGKGTSVTALVELICKIDNFKDAKLYYDMSKPGGPRSKLMDTSKAKKVLGYTSQISLEEGLRRTIKWYRENLSKN